jgi:putative sterol carrier protein
LRLSAPRLHDTMPLISPSVLSQRLKTLEQCGIVSCNRGADSRKTTYSLTAAGHELEPVLHSLGVWGQRWVRDRTREDDLDASFVMWDIRRCIRTEQLPSQRTVVYFGFSDAKRGMRQWWLVIDGDEVDLCLQDPGYDIDMCVYADLQSLTRVWMGDVELANAVSSGKVRLEGDRALIKTISKWFGPSPFAAVKSAAIT